MENSQRVVNGCAKTASATRLGACAMTDFAAERSSPSKGFRTVPSESLHQCNGYRVTVQPYGLTADSAQPKAASGYAQIDRGVPPRLSGSSEVRCVDLVQLIPLSLRQLLAGGPRKRRRGRKGGR